MTRGSFTVEVQHFCGQPIFVHVEWRDYPGSYWEPPDHDEDRHYQDEDGNQITRCPKCRVDPDYDDLFQLAAERKIDAEYLDAQPEPDDYDDYDPTDDGYDDNYIQPDERL